MRGPVLVPVGGALHGPMREPVRSVLRREHSLDGLSRPLALGRQRGFCRGFVALHSSTTLEAMSAA